MKTKNFVLLVLMLFSVSLFAQESVKDSVKHSNDSYEFIKQIIGKKYFVIEANAQFDKYGNQKEVNSIVNFIKVDSSLVTIQTGDDVEFGSNGVGGKTLTGPLTSWNVEANDKIQTIKVWMHVLAGQVALDVSIEVNGKGYATASITGTSSKKKIFSGEIVSLGESKIFVGKHL